MLRKERYQALIDYFSTHMPVAETELVFENPFQLLVAVVLSAQCTDKRVNMSTPAIFRDFPTPAHLAASNFDELFPYIKSISYPNNKTKHLLGLGKMLVENFNGEVPSTVEELVKLPGVGRKTANVITSVVWNQPNMAVDTHVFRVSKRLGLVNQNAKTPLEVEKQLIKHIPKKHVHIAHHWLILHGRYVCVARNPKCPECGIKSLCRYFEKNHASVLGAGDTIAEAKS
ncbi:Endonuclease III [Mariniradius saccharolyticus AK6]|uniref:Endonuclease III n=1 Tax=Mariniradius saccharolyticus AK6 TaxID=1239962 RepID=M7XWS0_9BACT|nr:endonuclease III [Mariniradius saccharolyticus]EMS32947.1 Endonuclease III [Mariniradius saccharolyticus AK6]